MSPFPAWGGAFTSLIFLTLAAALLAFSALRPQAFGGLRAGTADLFAPALGAVSRPFQNAALFVQDMSGLTELQAENERLRQENVRLREWYQTALLLEAENRSLKELMNVRLEPPNTYRTARVIADGGNTYVKSLLVSAGLEDGVKKNNAVLAADGLIGRVVEPGRRASRVLLITDINSRVPVIVEDSLQHAILAGQNDDFPRLIHMPQNSEISEGARIVTSGHGGVFPPGLPIGRVVLDEKGGRKVALYADMGRIMHVRVVEKPEDPNYRPAALRR